MTIGDSLKTISNYPLQATIVERICTRRGISSDGGYTSDVAASAAYLLAEADVYDWLSNAPDVTVNGESFSFTDADKARFRQLAKALRNEASTGKADSATNGFYGYVGDRL